MRDPDSIARCVPLVALYTGNPEMLSTAYDACSMIQSSDIILTIVLAACRVMEQYMLQDGTEADGSPQVEKVIGDLKSAKRTFPNDLDLAVSGFLADALATKEMTVDEATAKLGESMRDPDSIARCVPLVALYTGNPEMLSTAYDACSMIQSSDIILTIVLAACRVMEQYMLQDGTEADGSPQVEKVIGDLKSAKRTFPNDLDLAVSGFLADALATKEMTVDEATAKLGKA